MKIQFIGIGFSVGLFHWFTKRTKTYEGWHEFLHGFCPCQAWPEDDIEDLLDEAA